MVRTFATAGASPRSAKCRLSRVRHDVEAGELDARRTLVLDVLDVGRISAAAQALYQIEGGRGAPVHVHTYHGDVAARNHLVEQRDSVLQAGRALGAYFQEERTHLVQRGRRPELARRVLLALRHDYHVGTQLDHLHVRRHHGEAAARVPVVLSLAHVLAARRRAQVLRHCRSCCGCRGSCLFSIRFGWRFVLFALATCGGRTWCRLQVRMVCTTDRKHQPDYNRRGLSILVQKDP